MQARSLPTQRAILTVPNLLTLSRIPMAALVWLRPLDPVYVLGLMALAGISDVLDGWLERRREARLGRVGGESIGAWLDPLCDKIFILSVLLAVSVAHSLPFWIIPLIALREILQTLIVGPLRLLPAFRARMRPRFKANLVGKATTVLQFTTIGAILLGKPDVIPLGIATAGLGLLAVLVYVRRALA
jgi:phosphatidylglycerophosphate synthase